MNRIFGRSLPLLGTKRAITARPIQPKVEYAPTIVTTLPNGLRVATEDLGTDTTTVGLWIDCGTRYELLNEMGTAHFSKDLLGTFGRFEHLVRTFGRNICRKVLKNKRELEINAENTSTLMDAYTTRDHTCYYFQGEHRDAPYLIELLAKYVQNPYCNKGSIAMARQTIDKHYDDILNQEEEVIFDYIHAFCFGGLDGNYRESSLSYNILGTRRHIKSIITQSKIRNFIDKHYHPSRMVLVAAGGMDHDHVVELAKKSFTRHDKYRGPGTPTLERDNEFTAEILPEYENFWKPVTFHSCEIRENYGSGTVCGAMTFPSVGWSHKDSMTLTVLSQMIGMYSQDLEIQSKPKILKTLQQYDPMITFQTYSSQYHDTGLFGVLFTSFIPDKIPNIVNVLIEELESLSQNIDNDELEQHKKGIPQLLLMRSGTQPVADEVAVDVADEIGRHLLTYGRRIHYPEIEQQIADVTQDDIKRCINQLLSGPKCLCLVGDLGNIPQVFPELPLITDPQKIHMPYWCSDVE